MFLNNVLRLLLYLMIPCQSFHLPAQQVRVHILAELNASGGVTTDPSGNVYISDFGPKLGAYDNEPTHVYRWNFSTGTSEIFATGFAGASGACFDMEGNFFQSNPFSHRISRISIDGTVQLGWCASDLKTPVGLVADDAGKIYVSNCGMNEIGVVDASGTYKTFASSDEFRCPNGLTRDPEGNLYACNFGDGKILRIEMNGVVRVLAKLPELTGGPNPVGNGHLIYSNGWLFVTTIGTGEIYRVHPNDGAMIRVAGKPFAFTNAAGDATDASFNKPNGIAASITGDTLYVNVSEPTWASDPAGLHPAKLMMITGICTLPDANCR